MAKTRTRPLWNTRPAFIAALLVIIAVCLVLTSQASAAPLAGGTPTVSVGTIQVGVGGQGTAELVVSGVPAAGVGAWTVDVTYNSGIVSVADCTGLFGGVCNANVGPSLMRITGASAGGIFSTTALATITFTCNTLGTSVTGLNVSLLAHTNIAGPLPGSPRAPRLGPRGPGFSAVSPGAHRPFHLLTAGLLRGQITPPAVIRSGESTAGPIFKASLL